MLESLELLLLGSRDEVNAVHPRMRIFSAIPNCKACAATLTCFSRYGCLSTWSPVFDRRMAELAKWVILSLLKKCKTTCHSPSPPPQAGWSTCLRCSHLRGRDEVQNELGVGTTIDSRHFSPGYENGFKQLNAN